MRGQTCKMMLAMVLLVASRAAGGRDGPSTSAGADLIDLPSFGVALALPVGWWRGPEEREQDVFTCVRRDRTGTITGRIGMYFEPATAAADVNDLIRKRAARRDGTVREEPVKHSQRFAGTAKYGFRNRAFVGVADLFAVRWMKKRYLRYQADEVKRED